MNKVLFILPLVILIISCGNYSKSEYPKHDSTIIGIWKGETDDVIEITPTYIINWPGVNDTTEYVLKGDSLLSIHEVAYAGEGPYDTTTVHKIDTVVLAVVRFSPESLYIKNDTYSVAWPNGKHYTRHDSATVAAMTEYYQELNKKNAEKENNNRGHEQYGDYIDYCPNCGAQASQAYVVSEGMLVKEPYFLKGGPFVCYSCAKKLQDQYYHR
jgi:hypothetical protein